MATIYEVYVYGSSGFACRARKTVEENHSPPVGIQYRLNGCYPPLRIEEAYWCSQMNCVKVTISDINADELGETQTEILLEQSGYLIAGRAIE